MDPAIITYDNIQPVPHVVEIAITGVTGEGRSPEAPKIHVCDPNEPTAWEKKYGTKNPWRTSCHHLGVTDLNGYTEYLNKIGADEALDQLLRAGGERY